MVFNYFVEDILTSFHKRNPEQQNTNHHSIASCEYNAYLHNLTGDVHQAPRSPYRIVKRPVC